MPKDAPDTSPAVDGKVLIVIDAQKGFVTEASEHILEPIESLQYTFDKVVFTRFHNPDPSPFRRILKYCKLAPESEDTKLAISARDDAVMIERALYSCVTPELRRLLAHWKADEVYVTGIATEACVLKTVLDLVESDVRPWVIADLCASDKAYRYHDMALELIASLIGPEHIINSHALADAETI